METTLILEVERKPRPREIFLRRCMAALAVFFLLQAIIFSTGFMLPCFLMTGLYFAFRHAIQREYEYTLEDRTLKIDRVSDQGRRRLHDIPAGEMVLLCRPDAPEAQPYKKKGGTIRTKKFDYTSYREGVPYDTLIAREEGKLVKLLLDLTPEAERMIRRWMMAS